MSPCCNGTGFVGKTICVNHLEAAFRLAMAWGDKEMAAAILAKHQGKLCPR